MIYVYYSLIHKKILLKEIENNNKEIIFNNFNFLKLDASEKFDFVEIMNFCLANLLLNNNQNKKVIVIENANFVLIFNNKKNKNFDKFIKFLKKIPPNINLYFVFYKKDKLILNNELKKIINNNIVKFDIFKIFDWKQKYVIPMIKKKNIAINSDAIDELSRRTLNNFERLENEIEKLSFYDKQINLYVIKQLVFKNPEERIFELFNMLIKNNINQSISVCNDLIKKKNINSVSLLSLLAVQFRFMYVCNFLYKKKHQIKEIASLLKVHYFRVYSVINTTNNINEKLITIMDKIYSIEYNIKLNKINADIALELFIINFNL